MEDKWIFLILDRRHSICFHCWQAKTQGMFPGVGSFIHDHYAVVDLYMCLISWGREFQVGGAAIPKWAVSKFLALRLTITCRSMQKPEQLLSQRSCQRSDKWTLKTWVERAYPHRCIKIIWGPWKHTIKNLAIRRTQSLHLWSDQYLTRKYHFPLNCSGITITLK